ncbi:MAG: L,D-transpeptidase family protein [Proteobacteria bacterium]|nr:L,D-transpeptidase family protein [Pseudomonadota bacterium]
MKRRDFIPLTASAVLLSACGAPPASKFKAYDGLQITRVIVEKSTRSMWLMHEAKVIAKYDVELGFTPRGHKKIEGDGRTPEGSYFINRRNPNSAFHLSLGISYPNAKDIAKAKAIGKSPGGAIFIHGGPVLRGDRNKPDWTAGCISVTNEEIETIYAMVKNGTQIDILT